MYAVIKTGGKQYRVQEGEVLKVEKLVAEIGDSVEFDQILAVSTDDGLQVGTPFLGEAKVQAKVLTQDKDKKVVVYKYKAKESYHKKQGHRQPFTRVLIEKIVF